MSSGWFVCPLGRDTAERERESIIYLRHDVDFCLESAVNMARLENQMGIQSSFFILLDSPLYNIFEGTALRQIRCIESLGHSVGIHLDIEHSASPQEICHKFSIQYGCLKALGLRPLRFFSFHRPHEDQINLALPDGLDHAYSQNCFQPDHYLSDSGGRWKKDVIPLLFPDEKLARRINMQLLIHPLWWSKANLSVNERMQVLISRLNDKNRAHLKENCRTYKRGDSGC